MTHIIKIHNECEDGIIKIHHEFEGGIVKSVSMIIDLPSDDKQWSRGMDFSNNG